MRASTGIVVLLLTAIAIALLTVPKRSSISAPWRPKVSAQTALPLPTAAARAASPIPASKPVSTPDTLPIPAVYAANLVVIRGIIVDVVDGRAVVVSVTPAGRAAYRRLKAASVDAADAALAGWRADELATLARLLDRMADDFTGGVGGRVDGGVG